MAAQAQIVDLAKGADDLSAKERDRTLLREEWKLLRIEAIKDSREKKWAEAVRAEKQMVELIPKVDTLSSADQARELSSAYLSLSWYSLFARDFAGALRAGDDGLKLTPSNNMLDTNRAHALLFLGRTQEAEALYRKHLGESIGDKSWGETILDDLNALSAAGLSSPEFPAIRAMMEKDKKPEKTAKGTP
jgi:tetratricopeptide (TPR) repeat protein